MSDRIYDVLARCSPPETGPRWRSTVTTDPGPPVPGGHLVKDITRQHCFCAVFMHVYYCVIGGRSTNCTYLRFGAFPDLRPSGCYKYLTIAAGTIRTRRNLPVQQQRSMTVSDYGDEMF